MRYLGPVGLLLVSGAVAVGVALAASTSTLATGRINVTATRFHQTGRAVPPVGRQSNATEEAWRITDRNGTAVGRMIQQCRWILPRARYCQGELTMPRGKITFAGSSLSPLEGEYAVTGGTGAYRGGGGVMLFVAIGVTKSVLLITITT